MANFSGPASTGATEDLLLRVTAPRVPRDLYARPRLLSSAQPFCDYFAILVQAPAGFGKTSLLAQWRREHLARGAVVAWLLAQGRDEPQRLVQALVLAMRVGAARPMFAHTLLEATSPDGLEAATVWLAIRTQESFRFRFGRWRRGRGRPVQARWPGFEWGLAR